MSWFILLLGYFSFGNQTFSVVFDDHGRPELLLVRNSLLSRVVNPGTPVAMTGQGVVYTRSNGTLILVPFGNDSSHEIAAPEKNMLPLFSAQMDMRVPFVFTKNALFVLDEANHSWRSLEVKPTVSFTEPGREITGTYGLRIYFPDLVTLPKKGILTYNSRNGVTRVFNSSGQQVKQVKQAKRGHPVSHGNKLYWLNNPEEGTCSEATIHQPLNMKRSFSIPELNRYSMIKRSEKGFWVISFPMGLKQSLKSWGTGSVELTLTYIEGFSGKTNLTHHTLSDAPLNFELTASASGSPKLGVKPNFNVLPISSTDELAFLMNKEAILVCPRKGVKMKKPMAEKRLIFIQKGQNHYVGWDEDLQRVNLWSTATP